MLTFDEKLCKENTQNRVAALRSRYSDNIREMARHLVPIFRDEIQRQMENQQTSYNAFAMASFKNLTLEQLLKDALIEAGLDGGAASIIGAQAIHQKENSSPRIRPDYDKRKIEEAGRAPASNWVPAPQTQENRDSRIRFLRR